MYYTKKEKLDFSYKYINDPIYGGIGLSKPEVDIINTPAFQRLRYLRQLGLCNLVFPGGEHTRFSHSLGVLYIAGKVCEHLRDKGQFSEQDIIKVRIAALLHDIGHYPLSHLGEVVYSFREDKIGGVQPRRRDQTPPRTPEHDKLLIDIGTSKSKSAHHESLAREVLRYNKQVKSIITKMKLNPDEIASIISRKNISDTGIIYTNIIHSGLDADRLDYLLRDSNQTGVKFGLVDLDYLIRLMEIHSYTVSYNGHEKTFNVITYNSKGQHVIEHYLMCRYFHYSQVVWHKTTNAFEAITRVLFYKLLEAGAFKINGFDLNNIDNITSLKNRKRFINSPEWRHFTDETLLTSLYNYYLSTDDELYKLFYEAFANRKPPRSLMLKRDIVAKDQQYGFKSEYGIIKKLLQDRPDIIQRVVGLPLENIGYSFSKTEVESIPAYIGVDDVNDYEEKVLDAIKIYDGHNITLLASDKSSIINIVSDLISESINLFCVPNQTFDEQSVKIKLDKLISRCIIINRIRETRIASSESM